MKFLAGVLAYAVISAIGIPILESKQIVPMDNIVAAALGLVFISGLYVICYGYLLLTGNRVSYEVGPGGETIRAVNHGAMFYLAAWGLQIGLGMFGGMLIIAGVLHVYGKITTFMFG